MEAFSLNLIRRCNGVVRSASSKVELDTSVSCIQIPTSLAQFSCLKTYSLIWRVLDGYVVDDCFNRYILMEEMVEDGFLANASWPALESLHNALEDIASMQEAKIRQDPPAMDNFTQLWRDYFQALYGDGLDKNDFTRKMNEKRPDLSVEIVLCTDIYLDVQNLIPATDPNLIPDDYKRNWSSKNSRESSDQSDHGDIMNRLRQSPFTSKHIRQGLNSFLRNESETTTVVRDWLVGDRFWNRRALVKRILTRKGLTKEEGANDGKVINGVSTWDWPRYNPFLAGMIAFVTAQAVHEFNMVFQNYAGYPVAYAHFYNYLRQAHSVSFLTPRTPVLDQEWPDMEAFLKIMGDRSIFGGDRPANLQQCFQRTLLSHGIPLSAFSRGNHRKDSLPISKPKLKALSTPIIDVLFEDGINRRGFLNIAQKKIQDVIRREADRHVNDNHEDGADLKLRDLIGFLIAFRRTIQYEIPKLHFAHNLVFMQTWNINLRIHEALKDDLERQHDALFLDTLTWKNDPSIPLNIMLYEKLYQEQTTGNEMSTTKVYSDPVYKAASIIRDEIENGLNRVTPCTKRMEILARCATTLTLHVIHLANKLPQPTQVHQPPLQSPTRLPRQRMVSLDGCRQ